MYHDVYYLGTTKSDVFFWTPQPDQPLKKQGVPRHSEALRCACDLAKAEILKEAGLNSWWKIFHCKPYTSMYM